MQAGPRDCLFVSIDDKTEALIHLDGPDLSEQRMKELLAWEGRQNAYNRFGDMIEQTGKQLTAIYVTHAHADHYFGLGELTSRFPHARPSREWQSCAD